MSNKVNKYRGVGAFIYDDILHVSLHGSLDGASSKNVPAILAVCVHLVTRNGTVDDISTHDAEDVNLLHRLLVRKDKA